MPMINVKLIEGVFNETQKKKMVTALTDAMVAIEGESMRQVTCVVIKEVSRAATGQSAAGRSRRLTCMPYKPEETLPRARQIASKR